MFVVEPRGAILQQKVAYLSDQRFPVRNATTEQLLNTISALSAEGLDVRLVIPRQWRNLRRSNQRLKETLSEFYHIEDSFCISQLLHLPFAPFKLDKVTHGLLAPLFASIVNCDIIYTRNLLPAMTAIRLQKKVVLETFQLYGEHKPKTAKQTARLTHSPKLLNIITHSVPSRNSLLDAGAVEEKVTVIPNGFNPAALEPRLSKTEARRQLGWDEREKIACYTGRIDVDKGVLSLLHLAQRTPEVTYVLIGYSEKKQDDWMVREALSKGVKNLKHLPWVTAPQLSKYLCAADVLVIPPTLAPIAKYRRTVLPMKTFLYMAAGRCILAPASPDLETVLCEKNAVLVEPDNLDEAAALMRRVFENQSWARALSEQAQLDSENYTWKNRARRIISLLEDRLKALPR
ncbi:MAG: glycosyltransferase family 4 protein [bacterium]